MLVVMALGGNTPLRLIDVARAVRAIAAEHAVVVTHSNGPHARLLATTRNSDPTAPPSGPGVNARILEIVLAKEMPDRQIASRVTDVMVRLVPLGPHYADTDEGRGAMAGLGWMVVQDGTGFRRCIPTPEPQRIIQLEAIEALIGAGVLLICPFGAGIGAGIPITECESVPWRGAVPIDEDMAAALLAEQVGADLLMLLGNVDVGRAAVHWTRGAVPPLGASTHEALKRISLGPGLIGPKAEAACRFVESTGRRAAIGAVADAPEILRGDGGVQVVAEPAGTVDVGGAGSPVTVLVVDDNEVATRLCRRVLEKAGYRVLTASDGLGAVSLALASSPDMILLDCAMPGMRSPEAMRLIRKQRPDIPIVIATVDPSAWNRQRYLAAGADGLLNKPFKLTDLTAMVAKITANRGLQKPS
jgi:carbamate kinase